jgi:hypothetical protein
MTRNAAPPPGGISYAEYLQREIEDRIQGTMTFCGPPIADYPTTWNRIWPYSRPHHALESRLEARLRHLEAQA